MDTPQPPSSYLDYLPAIFRQDPFIGQFLLAFEAVLSGTGAQPGLETTIGGIARYFDPAAAGPEFLPWLAGWVTLSLRADWDEQTQRSFIQKIVPLYKLRGTRDGLWQMLNLYTGQPVEIYDAFDDRPYFFEVQLTLSAADPVLLRTTQQIARAIIDQEKPAHTYLRRAGRGAHDAAGVGGPARQYGRAPVDPRHEHPAGDVDPVDHEPLEEGPMADYALPAVVEKRVRYFDGQYLQDQDFIDEQDYQLDREHRHNRLLHGPGIADGLTVTSSAPNQVTVAPGTAIDSDGNQLVLAQATTVDLPAAGFNDKTGVQLYISYLQSAEDPQTVAGSADFTRWLERPQLTALAPGQTYSGTAPPVLLAALALDNAGHVEVDSSVRSYSGLRLPGSAADAAILHATAPARWTWLAR